MGFHVEWNGDPEITPAFCSNSGGSRHWGGRHESTLSAADLIAILQFCESEGWRQGWNDSLYDRVNVDRPNPHFPDLIGNNIFHPDLLGGYPFREWNEHYRRGVREREEHPTFGIKKQPAAVAA